MVNKGEIIRGICREKRRREETLRAKSEGLLCKSLDNSDAQRGCNKRTFWLIEDQPRQPCLVQTL